MRKKRGFRGKGKVKDSYSLLVTFYVLRIIPRYSLSPGQSYPLSLLIPLLAGNLAMEQRGK